MVIAHYRRYRTKQGGGLCERRCEQGDTAKEKLQVVTHLISLCRSTTDRLYTKKSYIIFLCYLHLLFAALSNEEGVASGILISMLSPTSASTRTVTSLEMKTGSGIGIEDRMQQRTVGLKASSRLKRHTVRHQIWSMDVLQRTTDSGTLSLEPLSTNSDFSRIVDETKQHARLRGGEASWLTGSVLSTDKFRNGSRTDRALWGHRNCQSTWSMQQPLAACPHLTHDTKSEKRRLLFRLAVTGSPSE